MRRGWDESSTEEGKSRFERTREEKLHLKRIILLG